MLGSLILILFASTPREDFDQAVEAYRNGLYGPALYAMEQLLLEPDFDAADSALLLAGQSAYALARYDKALRYLERHIAESGDPAPQALEKGIISALELNQTDKAYALFHNNPRFETSQETKLRLAQTFEQLKDYEKAREMYMAIPDPDLRLVGAKMLLAAGRYDLLATYLADLEQTYPEVAATVASLQIEATLSRGDSLSSLEAGLAMGEPSTLGSTEAYTLGKLFASLNLFEDAVRFYEPARAQRRYDVLLPLGYLYVQLGDYRQAVRIYEEAREKAVTFSTSDRAEEAKARLLSGRDFDAQALADARFASWDEYRRVLDLLLAKGQTSIYERLLLASPFVRPEDVLRKARLLCSQGRPREALSAYRQYLGSPFGSERAAASREADIVELFEIKDAEAALKKLVAATTSAEKGKVLFEDAKDYEGAIAFLDTVADPEAFYYSALAYERLYLRDGKVKFLDEARERYDNLYWQYPESRWTEDALYRLFATEIRDPLKKMDRALEYLDHYPEGRYSDEVRFLMGFVQLARGDTFAAKGDWETLYLTRPESPYNFPVLYELAALALAEADTSDASAKLSLILSVAPHDTLYFASARRLAELEETHGRKLDALMLYRKMAAELGWLPVQLWQKALDLTFALRQYNELDNFYSSMKDLERRQEIDFYRQAAKVESKLADSDDLKVLLHERPANRTDEYLYWAGVGASLANHPRLGRHLLETLVSLGRDSLLVAKAEFLVAQHQIAAGEDSGAVSRLRDLYSRNPADTLVLAKLVTALYRAGELAEADSLWRKLDVASAGDQSPLLLEKAAYLLNANRTEEADTILEKLSLIRELWKDPNFVYYKGIVASKSGRTEEALELFRRFHSDFPTSQLIPNVEFKLGTLYYMLGEPDSATAYYRRTLESPELRRSALENLAKIARSQKKYEEAMRYFEMLAEEVPTPAERGSIYTELGVTAYYANKFSQSITYFERALPLVTGERPYLLFCTARSYAAFLDPEHLEKAVSLFLQCHEEFPQDQWGLESWFQAGMGYLALDRPDDARLVLTAILNQRGENDPFGMRAKTELERLE